MHHTSFGKTGLHFPPVVFGTPNLGNLFVEHSNETKLAISRAWFAHVPKPIVVDTAGKYGAGLALEVLGHNLRQLGVAADDVIISNKLGWRRAPLKGHEATFEPGAWVGLQHDATQSISHRGILACWEEGNQLLGEPYRADLLSVHDPDEYLAAATTPGERNQRLDDILDAFRALRELQQQGKVKAVGVGAKDWRTIREIDSLVELDWVMIANSLTFYSHPPEIVDFVASLHSRGVGVINSAVFHAGFLVGGDFFDYRRISASSAADRRRIAWRSRFHELSEAHGVPPATACIRFAMSPPGVHAIAMNSSRPDRIAHDVSACTADIPSAFWDAAKDTELIDPSYPYV